MSGECDGVGTQLLSPFRENTPQEISPNGTGGEVWMHCAIANE